MEDVLRLREDRNRLVELMPKTINKIYFERTEKAIYAHIHICKNRGDAHRIAND